MHQHTQSRAESTISVTYQDAANLVKRAVKDLFANGVVATSIIIGRVLLSANQQLRVKERTVVASTDLVDRGGIQVDKDGPRDVFAAARLGEDGIELARVVNRLGFRIRTTILLQAVLEQIAMAYWSTTGLLNSRNTTPTAPRRYYPAACPPGQCANGESGQRESISIRSQRIPSRGGAHSSPLHGS